jgi:hypothetical protein
MQYLLTVVIRLHTSTMALRHGCSLLSHVVSHLLSHREEDFYSALYTQSQAQFNTYLASGTVLNNYAHIFDILIRLRQAVDHPYLVIYSDTQVAAKSDSANFLSVGAVGTGEQRYIAHVVEQFEYK